MTKDAADQKSLTNKNVVLILLFLLSVAISSTYFVATKLGAAPPTCLSPHEKKEVLQHVEKETDDALERQKIHLEQKAFNAMILKSLQDMNEELRQLNAEYKETKLEVDYHINNRNKHL